jgi:hypothetical protein
MHPAAFEPCLNDELIGTLDGPAGDRIALLGELRVLDLRPALLQIRDHAVSDGLRLLWPIRSPGREGTERRQHPTGVSLFELLKLDPEPFTGRRRSAAQDRVGSSAHMFGRMGEVQNADRIRPMLVDQPLKPFGSIHHCADHSGALGASAMNLSHGQPSETLRIGKPTEVGQLARVECARLFAGYRLAHSTNHQRLDLCPLPMHEWHHRAVGAELLDGGSRW